MNIPVLAKLLFSVHTVSIKRSTRNFVPRISHLHPCHSAIAICIATRFELGFEQICIKLIEIIDTHAAWWIGISCLANLTLPRRDIRALRCTRGSLDLALDGLFDTREFYHRRCWLCVSNREQLMRLSPRFAPEICSDSWIACARKYWLYEHDQEHEVLND